MRFRVRFGLRALFVLVTLSALAFGWLAWQRHVVQQRKRVLEQVVAS